MLLWCNTLLLAVSFEQSMHYICEVDIGKKNCVYVCVNYGLRYL